MTAPQRPTQLLAVTDVAARLSCSRGHVYGLIAAGVLRTVNITAAHKSKTRIYETDLEAFIESRTQ